MTPSATPQRKKKDDYDHPLRRSPRGETGPPREQTVEGGSPAQLAVERAGRLESHAVRPRQLRDGDRSFPPRRPARRGALSGPFRLQGEAQFRRPDAGRAGRAWRSRSCRAMRPMCRWRIAPATGSISAATPSRKFPCAQALDLLKPILEDEASSRSCRTPSSTWWRSRATASRSPQSTIPA